MSFHAFLILLLFSAEGNAALLCEKKPNSYRELVQCAEESSPEVQRAKLHLERARAQVGAAAQWQNPELSADSYFLSSEGGSGSETEVSLGIPIELGGKIASRKEVATGALAQAEIALLSARAEAKKEITAKLHRLRQTKHELEVVEEAISTFQKLLAQFAKRPALAPEQKVSAAVFRMAMNEDEMEKAKLLEEHASLDSYLKVVVGLSADEVQNLLPKGPVSWPEVPSLVSIANSPKLKLIEAELKTAEAELGLARSEAWPTVMIGPSVKLEKEAGLRETTYGFNLSLPLPLFSFNGGAKASAGAGLRIAETQKTLAISEEERRREKLLRTYKSSVAALQSALSHPEMEKGHRDVERLFIRGTVPSSLVIEAHRTFVGLERARHEAELKALESLMEIYLLDGKLSEINL